MICERIIIFKAKRQTDRFGSDKLGELNQIMTMTRSVVGDKVLWDLYLCLSNFSSIEFKFT